MSVRKPEDLTLEEVREQMALYQRLYYHKVKETPEFKAKKADVQRQYYLRRKAKKEEERKADESTSEEPPKQNNREYFRKYKKDVNEAYILV